MTRSDAHKILDLARSGAPIPEGVLSVALYETGDAVKPKWEDYVDSADFVHAMRRAELLGRNL
jgi:hypothetical protein